MLLELVLSHSLFSESHSLSLLRPDPSCCPFYSFSTGSSLPSDFFDTSVKPAVEYSDSESEEEKNGNEDAPQPLQQDEDQESKDGLRSEKPSQQLLEKAEDQEGCVLCSVTGFAMPVTPSAFS